MAWVYVLVLVSLVVTVAIAGEEPDDASIATPPMLAVQLGLDLAAGGVGIFLLGRGSLRESLGGRARPVDIGLGVSIVPLTLGCALGFSALVTALFKSGSETEPTLAFSAINVIGIAVLPALIEEWICRGILWEALRRTAPGATLVGTAILFAMMHGLGGGYLLELPHRFVMGLLIGWVRLRSGSLVPGIVTHFLHNLLAILIG